MIGGYNPEDPVSLANAQHFIETDHSELYAKAGRPTIIAGGTGPSGYRSDPSTGFYIKSGSNNYVAGVTTRGGVGNRSIIGSRKSTIHLSKAAFNSAMDLYLTSGHELIHAQHWFDGTMFNGWQNLTNNGYSSSDATEAMSIYSEIQAHQWSYKLSSMLLYPERQLNAKLNLYRYGAFKLF